MAVATKILYMLLAAGKYRRNVLMSHPKSTQNGSGNEI